MAEKGERSMSSVIAVSALVSLVCSAAFLFIYFRVTTPPSLKPATATKVTSTDPNFAKYETIINGFLDTIRKGQIEAAYKSTSPVFQKLTTLDQFTTLIAGYKSINDIPAGPCTLTQYTDPLASSIKGLPDTYMIVQTQCEVKGKDGIRGFDIEFIDDKGTPKISYINVYQSPITHTKQ